MCTIERFDTHDTCIVTFDRDICPHLLQLADMKHTVFVHGFMNHALPLSETECCHKWCLKIGGKTWVGGCDDRSCTGCLGSNQANSFAVVHTGSDMVSHFFQL